MNIAAPGVLRRSAEERLRQLDERVCGMAWDEVAGTALKRVIQTELWDAVSERWLMREAFLEGCR